VGDIYNLNRGTEQPTLTNHDVVFLEGNGFGVALPFFNANNHEFGLNEDTCYNRWMDLIEGAGAAVSAGGALTFYELNFLTIGVNAIDFKLRESGDNTTLVTIKNAKVTNPKTVGEQEGELSNPTGTNLLAWGSPEHGSLPVSNSKYNSGIMKFVFRPEWVTATVYAVDARVKDTPTTGTTAAKHYKANVAHTSGATFAGDIAKWDQIDMGDEFGDSILYSPWTDGKNVVWRNNGCDPENTVFTAGGWCDINLVINDEEFYRTWVDVRLNDFAGATDNDKLDAIAVTSGEGYSYDGTRAGFPRGFRILVDDDSPDGELSAFPNMVVEEAPTNSVGGKSFQKLYNFTSASDKVQVAVIHEGKIYEFDNGTTSWGDISEADIGNDCFHPYTSIPTNVDGIDLVLDPAAGAHRTRSKVTDSTERPDISKSGGTFITNLSSAIQFKTVNGTVGTSFPTDASDELDPFYLEAIGFNLRFPYPNNNFNGISDGVGDIYGGGINSNLEPATLDIQNMNYTSGGLEGFNQGSESEDYGQINAVAFWLNYSITVQILGQPVELNDEHQFRAWFMDTKDNVVYQDFVVRFSNHWEDIRLPIGGFRVYKGRKPLYGFDVPIATIIPPKELEIIDIFEWRNIKIFGVQVQSVYDDQGRYNPAAAAVDEAGNSVTWSALLASTRTLQLDGFRFIKPLLVTSGQDTTRNLEPDFMQFPNITIYDQLLNAAKSQLEIEKFKHKEFNIETSGDDVFDIPFGDGFILENDELVNDSDSGGNTIKLVAKRIEYSITKPPGGRGGLRRRIQGSKIFT